MIGKEFRELKKLRSESEILLSNQAIKSTTPGVAYMQCVHQFKCLNALPTFFVKGKIIDRKH